MTNDNYNKSRLLVTREGVSYVLPFIVVTCCFALWGFANDITNPMVKAFSKIFRMSVTDGTLVQVAFYGGYFCMALPAAMFIRRHSFKSGIIMGLALYALGVLLFIPARSLAVSRRSSSPISSSPVAFHSLRQRPTHTSCSWAMPRPPHAA